MIRVVIQVIMRVMVVVIRKIILRVVSPIIKLAKIQVVIVVDFLVQEIVLILIIVRRVIRVIMPVDPLMDRGVRLPTSKLSTPITSDAGSMNYVPFPALTDSPQTILTATTLLDVQNLLQSPTPSGSNFSVYASGIESGLINVGTEIIRGLPNSMLTNGEFMLGDLTGIPYFTNQAVNNTLNGLVNMGQNLSALYATN